LVLAPDELAGVRVLMAIAAKLVRHLFLEIVAGVTFLTNDTAVFASQRKVR
jgi:hypothetical protein